MKNLIRLFYLSKAAPGFGKSDITEILDKSATNNKKLGITGVLCYRSKYFAQILEGEELAVLELYVKIARDKRHTDLVILSVSTTARQIFKGWAMGGIPEDAARFIGIDEILKLRNSGPEHTDAVVMMQRWLKLLESRS